jgi:hypothetical protein
MIGITLEGKVRRNHEYQFLINQMLNDENDFFKKDIQNNQSQLVLTFETCNPGHEPRTNLIEVKP